MVLIIRTCRETGAAYINLTDAEPGDIKVKSSQEMQVSDGRGSVVLDFDEDGLIVGIEIL